MKLRCGLIVMSLLLAACGGGGGGGGGGTSVTVPPPVTTGGSGSQTVERGDVQAALAGVEGFENEASGGSSALVARRLLAHVDAKKIAQRRLIAGATCDPNGTGGIEESDSESGNTVTITIETFYDPSCTTAESLVVWNASVSGDDVTGPGTFTDYASNGTTVTESANAQITFVYNGSPLLESSTLTGISILLTNEVVNGTAVGSTAVACEGTATAVCSVAEVADGSSGEVGAVADVDSLTATSISESLATYAGSNLAIVQAAFPDWTITPAADEIGSASIRGGSSTGGGFTLTLTDATNAVTVSVTGTAADSVSGTLTATGSSAALATFTIDSSGNGTLTYANGTQVPIEDYIVQS